MSEETANIKLDSNSFFKEYQELCKKYGLQLLPALRAMNDLGGSIICLTIVPFEEKK